MKVTIKQDSMGCLHMWKGDHLPIGSGMTWKVNGKWSDVFIQDEESVMSVMSELSRGERGMLSNGYVVVTNRISEDYFTE